MMLTNHVPPLRLWLWLQSVHWFCDVLSLPSHCLSCHLGFLLRNCCCLLCLHSGLLCLSLQSPLTHRVTVEPHGGACQACQSRLQWDREALLLLLLAGSTSLLRRCFSIHGWINDIPCHDHYATMIRTLFLFFLSSLALPPQFLDLLYYYLLGRPLVLLLSPPLYCYHSLDCTAQAMTHSDTSGCATSAFHYLPGHSL